MSGFLSLLLGFPERNEEFSLVVLQKPCESLGACSGCVSPRVCSGESQRHAHEWGVPEQGDPGASSQFH